MVVLGKSSSDIRSKNSPEETLPKTTTDQVSVPDELFQVQVKPELESQLSNKTAASGWGCQLGFFLTGPFGNGNQELMWYHICSKLYFVDIMTPKAGIFFCGSGARRELTKRVIYCRFVVLIGTWYQVPELRFCFVLFSLQLSVCLWWHDYRREDFPTLKFGVVLADLLAIC